MKIKGKLTEGEPGEFLNVFKEHKLLIKGISVHYSELDGFEFELDLMEFDKLV